MLKEWAKKSRDIVVGHGVVDNERVGMTLYKMILEY